MNTEINNRIVNPAAVRNRATTQDVLGDFCRMCGRKMAICICEPVDPNGGSRVNKKREEKILAADFPPLEKAA